MTHHYATPGVYIEEQTGPGVIAGVSTSTVAFIGPALNGPINSPQPITSWEEFVDKYGLTNPAGPAEIYITSPRTFYMAHAVRGFFDNGGHFAYIIRVGTAMRSFANLPAIGGGNALRIEALKEGLDGNSVTVEVQNANLASGVAVAQASSAFNTSAQARRVKVSNASSFKPGDTVTITGSNERSVIERIDYATNDIFLTADLTQLYSSGTLQIADLQIGQKTFRLGSTAGLYPGSEVSIRKGTGTPEYATLANVRDGFVILEKGLANSYAMTGAPATITSYEFTLIIRKLGANNEPFANLSMNACASELLRTGGQIAARACHSTAEQPDHRHPT